MNAVNAIVVPIWVSVISASLCLACGTSETADWSRFRGPNGSGVAETIGLPVEFGPEKNVIWKTALPPGHSSPVLSEHHIFLTAFEGETLLTYCLDRETGEVIWRREAPRNRKEKLNKLNTPASPSPVTDGGIVTSFEPATGKVIHQGRLKGAIDKFFASPVAADDKIFMVSESGKAVVVKPDGSLEVLAVNDLEESCYATPAVADGRIYIRTRATLYCFGALAGVEN